MFVIERRVEKRWQPKADRRPCAVIMPDQEHNERNEQQGDNKPAERSTL